jgi:hypothetical protein
MILTLKFQAKIFLKSDVYKFNTDFGVSVWKEKVQEGFDKPFYIGDKGIYAVSEGTESMEYHFDVRCVIISLLLI